MSDNNIFQELYQYCGDSMETRFDLLNELYAP
jgi:hypothetical protein